MTVSKAQQKAVNKYIGRNYDRLNILVPKGMRDKIKAAAAEEGETLNSYVKGAIDSRMRQNK